MEKLRDIKINIEVDTNKGYSQRNLSLYEDESILEFADRVTLEMESFLEVSSSDRKIILSETAKSKLDFIKGHCIAHNFPNEEPTKEWAGAVLDFIDELGLFDKH